MREAAAVQWRVLRWFAILSLISGCDEVFDLAKVTERPDADVVDAAAPDAALAMFEDDFEGAIHPRWTRSLENGDSCEVTTEQAVSGSYSLKCTTDGLSGTRAALVLPFEPTPTLRVQMDVRFAARPASFVAFLQTVHASDTQVTRLVAADFYDNARMDVWNYKTRTFNYHPASAFSLDTWYRVDFKTQISSTDGNATLEVAGHTGSAALGPIDMTDLPINQLHVGVTLVLNAVEQLTVYIDNVVVTP
jgi:hypothetical protein